MPGEGNSNFRRRRNCQPGSDQPKRGAGERCTDTPRFGARRITIVSHGDPVMKMCGLLKNLAAIFILAASLPAQTIGTKDAAVTPVAGESWLKHLHRSFDETSMGRTWDVGPAARMPGQEPPYWQPELTPGFATNFMTLHGSDLYRLNCQGCHGASGA